MRDVGKFLRSKRGELTDLLCQLIRFESTEGKETPVQDFTADFLRGLGYGVQKVPIPEGIRQDPEYTKTEREAPYEGRYNLVVKFGRGEGRSLIINAHNDVVPAEEWAEAFRPKVEGDVVYGRGACDDKGSVVAIAGALWALKEMSLVPRGEVIVEIVIEEEVGGNGSLALIRQGFLADAALVMEGTRLRIHPANRGALWFKAVIKGKPVHMGKKWEGVSAIEKACNFVRLCQEFEARLIEESRGHPLFPMEPPPAQVNVGTIRGGEWPSMVPARVELEGGIGFLPNKDLKGIREEFVNFILSRADPWLREHITFSFERLHNDAYETPVDHPFVKTAQEVAGEMGLDTTLTGMVASCDARLFAKVGGMPTIVFGPGDLERAHSDRECVSMTEVLKAAEFLCRLILRWCGGEKE